MSEEDIQIKRWQLEHLELNRELNSKLITRTFAVQKKDFVELSGILNDFIANKEVLKLDYFGGCQGIIATVTVKVPIEVEEEVETRKDTITRTIDQDGNVLLE